VTDVVQAMLDDPPPSWVAAFRYHGLPTRPDVEDVVETMLEETAGGNDAGPRGKKNVFVPPDVASTALRGLKRSWREDYAGWNGIGLARAVQLATQPKIWQRAQRRIVAYLLRHQATRGQPAWDNWGGEAAFRWLVQE
jgi:hypothetical protein